MAITETFVDPSLDDTIGTGSVGTPYGDLQHALDTVTRNPTDGDRFHIKSGTDDGGTDEFLAAALDLTGYGTPTAAAPCMFEGYTDAAHDGGIGGIDGDGTYGMIANVNLDYMHFRNLHLHNSGAVDIISLDNDCSLIGCELDNTSSNGANMDGRAWIIGNYFHNIGGRATWTFASSVVYGNYYEKTGTHTMVSCILVNTAICAHNVMNIDGATWGIEYQNGAFVMNNSIYSAGGTGQGILVQGTNRTHNVILNNVVEGFAGAGGIGIHQSPDDSFVLFSNNSVYNCTDEYVIGGDNYDGIGTNDTLSESPFVDALNGDFRVTVAMRGASYPQQIPQILENINMDRGAVQRVERAILAG